MADKKQDDTKTITPAAALRKLRTIKGWTLKDVSERTGLAISTLSKLENGRLGLTYDKLASITSGLDVDVAYLFNSNMKHQAGNGTAGRRSVARKGKGVLMRSKTYDHLFVAADLLSKQFTPIIGEIRARSLKELELLRHPGEEYTYVLEGVVELHTDVYAPLRLEAGDSVYFDSSMRHAWLAVSSGPCRILSVCSAIEGKYAEHSP